VRQPARGRQTSPSNCVESRGGKLPKQPETSGDLRQGVELGVRIRHHLANTVYEGFFLERRWLGVHSGGPILEDTTVYGAYALWEAL